MLGIWTTLPFIHCSKLCSIYLKSVSMNWDWKTNKPRSFHRNIPALLKRADNEWSQSEVNTLQNSCWHFQQTFKNTMNGEKESLFFMFVWNSECFKKQMAKRLPFSLNEGPSLRRKTRRVSLPNPASKRTWRRTPAPSPPPPPRPHIILYVNCFGKAVLHMCTQYRV